MRQNQARNGPGSPHGSGDTGPEKRSGGSPSWLAYPVLTFGLSLGCQSALSTDARMSAELDGTYGEDKTDSNRDEPAESDRPLTREQVERARELADAAPANEGPALLGARHDVTVKSTTGAVACRCVQALLGPPTMNQVEWQGTPPATIPETQLLVALAIETDCPGAPEGSQGSSYWGYRISGDDVIIVLESWRPEPRKPGGPVPPRTAAAIIPKPPAGGAVYLAPLTSALPFGAPMNGKGTRCVIGNPGPVRKTPITPQEQADSATASGTDD